MPRQIILYNLRDDIKDEDYIKWCREFKGPLLLGLKSVRSFTVLKMGGGRKWNGQKGQPPEETTSPFKFIGILDVTSKEEWMKDVATEAYQKDFSPNFSPIGGQIPMPSSGMRFTMVKVINKSAGPALSYILVPFLRRYIRSS